MATASVRLPKTYTQDDDFQLWLKRFEIYANITELKGDVKVASLLSLLDETSFRLFELLELSEQDQEDYDVVSQALLRCFQKHTESEPELRYNFVQRRQQDTEDVSGFGYALVELADKAYKGKPKELRQELIRDQFIQGVKDDYIQEKLLQESPRSYADALSMARTLESARRARGTLTKQRGNQVPVNLVDHDIVKLVEETAGRVVEGEVSSLKSSLSTLIDEMRQLRVNGTRVQEPDQRGYGRSRSPYRNDAYSQPTRSRHQSPYRRENRSSSPYRRENSASGSYRRRDFSPHPRHSVTFRGYTDDGTIICYECGQPGHIRRYCLERQAHKQPHLNEWGPMRR